MKIIRIAEPRKYVWIPDDVMRKIRKALKQIPEEYHGNMGKIFGYTIWQIKSFELMKKVGNLTEKSIPPKIIAKKLKVSEPQVRNAAEWWWIHVRQEGDPGHVYEKYPYPRRPPPKTARRLNDLIYQNLDNIPYLVQEIFPTYNPDVVDRVMNHFGNNALDFLMHTGHDENNHLVYLPNSMKIADLNEEINLLRAYGWGDKVDEAIQYRRDWIERKKNLKEAVESVGEQWSEYEYEKYLHRNQEFVEWLMDFIAKENRMPNGREFPWNMSIRSRYM